MDKRSSLDQTKRIGTALSFIVFPLVFVFAFATHPNLLSPRFLGPEAMILRLHGASILHFGHALVTLNTALLVVVALHFMSLLERTPMVWTGFIGGAIAVLGSLSLAADKGALCLTMSALDTLSTAEFTQMMPGLLAIFAKQGWMVLIWGIVLLPIGFGLQAFALIRAQAIPRWQSILFLVGVLLIAVPDGVEIINLSAAILLSIAFVPYGIQLIQGSGRNDIQLERSHTPTRRTAI